MSTIITIPAESSGSSGGGSIGSAIGSGTSGSVLFIDVSGNLAQDNANFFWDATNKRLGIGTAAAPTTAFHVVPATAATVGILVQGASAQSANLQNWTTNGGILVGSVDKDGYVFSTSGFNSFSTADPTSMQIRSSLIGFFALTARKFLFGYDAGSDSFCVINAAGRIAAQFIQAGNAAYKTGGGDAAAVSTVVLAAQTSTASHTLITATAATSQTATLQEWQDSSGNKLSSVSKGGYFMTKKVSAPADADVGTSELAFWLDDTAGVAKAMFKAKDSGGTVRTGSVALV